MTPTSFIRGIALFVLLAVAAPSWAAGEVASIAVYPPNVHLSGSADRQRVVVVATRTDGVTLDVTAEAQLTLADAAPARLDGPVLHPTADGQTTLRVAHAGQQAEIPVVVVDAGAEQPMSFRLDVMPIFMRTGCNTGSCHGAARGKDGFRLSIFSFDPAGDHFRLTREIGPRRINLALPTESLLLEKATATVAHSGGKCIDPESEYYQTLVRWLQQGAPDDAADVATVDRVELFPPEGVLEGEAATQQFIVRAHYSDGTDRDVTNLAVFSSNNDNSAAISADGLATAAKRGEAFIMARFEPHSVGSQVLTLPKDLQYTPPEVTGNYIDTLVGEKLRKVRVLPSELCTDEEFLRRATVDITGKLPTAEEYAQFLADASADKRAQLIDRLLERKEFSEIWAMKWAELLMIKSNNQVSYKSAFLYASWLTDQIANDVPLDEMVRNVLGASGGTFSNPATNYYQIETDTLKTAENVAQVFMGIRTQCAQCHNHPFDRWKMDDYYSFAAFFAQIGRKQGEDYRETIVFNRGGGDVRHKIDNRVMAPKFLGGDVPDVAGKDRRAVMAEWLTAPENPFFRTSVANRVWAHFFGRGIVDPVDDVRVSNPPSNPQLLQTLGDKLVEYNYDFKQLVRDICNSQAYQRSTRPNESNAHDMQNFARATVRRIPAETLLDCISQATATQDKFRGLPLGARAVQIADGSTTNYFLTTFGRSQRTTVCACEAKTEPTLSQALHLLNGSAVHNKVRQGGLVQRWLDEGLAPPQIVEAIYIRCLARKPTAEESGKLVALAGEAASPRDGLEDVFWAVMNSREFLFNH